MRRRILLALAVLLVLPGSAGAAVIQDFGDFTAGTNGIALGADGNFWVAEQGSGTVARMTPAGQVIGRVTVGAGPTSVTTGPDSTVWVSVTGADRLARIDTRTSAVTFVATNGATGCGPVGIADGGNGRIYYSQPSEAAPCGSTRISSVRTDGTDIQTFLAGDIFDLAVTSGKVYAPDFSNDAVRRYSLALGAPETSLGAIGSPDGIVADGAGNLWVTLFGAGGVARFPAGQNGGTAQTFLPPAGATLSSPFGITAANDGRIWVAAKNGTIARVAADGTFKLYATGGGEPFDIARGPDDDVYFTDQSSSRVRRLISSAPRITGGAGTATATTSANVSASIDARGNATTVTFEYGPTTAYGAAVTVPANGVGPFPIGATLTGLAPGTTYHFRVRAINEEGEAAPGGDLTFATPAAPKPIVTLKARANFSWGFIGSRTVLTRIRVTDLSGGETIKVTCSSKRKGCPLKSKTYKNVKKGTRTLTSLFGKKKKLKTGAKIVVTITKPGAIGSTATVTIGKKKKDPKIVRKTVKPA